MLLGNTQAHCASQINKLIAGSRKKISYIVTVPEKRDFVAQNKKIEMLVGRFNPPLFCAKILKGKTLYAWMDGQPNLPYCSRAIEVKNEKTFIEVPLPV